MGRISKNMVEAMRLGKDQVGFVGRDGGHVGGTAYATVKDRERCVDAGFDVHFSKPCRQSELRQAIEHPT